MGISLYKLVAVIINFALVIGIIYAAIKLVQGIKAYKARNKEIDKKLDEILKKLDDAD